MTVAVSLLTVATLAVALALPSQSPALLSAAAVTAIVLAWAAVRIVWTEVLQSRRENGADRAAAAHAYRTLFTERAAEHAEFTTAMTERLAASNLTLRELQGALVVAQRDAVEQRLRAERAEGATTVAEERVAELEKSIAILVAEREAELIDDEPERGSLDDLMSFDEKVAHAAGKHSAEDTAKLA